MASDAVVAATVGKAPEFDWKPRSTLPMDGKYIVLCVNPRHHDISINTIKVWPEMSAEERAQQVVWVVGWDYFPQFVVKVEPAGGDGKKAAA